MSDAERMRALLAGYRQEIAATSEDRLRVWARLERDEAIVAAPQPQTHHSVALAVVVAVAVAAAIVLVLGLAERIVERDAATAPQQAPAVVEHAAEVEATAHVPTPARPPSPIARPPAEPHLEGAPRRPSSIAPRQQRIAVDPLNAEVALVDAARAAIDRGAPEAALTQLAEHRRRFPDAALAPEARALRAIALCAAGRTAQGRGEARLLLRERDSVAHHARVREACDVQ